MNIHGQVSLVLCSALFAAGTAAQEPSRSSDGRDDVYVPAEPYIPAEPLKRSAPDYPQKALENRQEGWVRVSFIISEEGGVIEPMIEDSSNRVFDESTLRAIKNWRYKPATLGGKPVEQSMVETIIRYQFQGGNGASPGASPQFVKKYRAISQLIAAKNLAEADPLLQALDEGELNYYEAAWLSWLKYVYLDATGTAEPEALIEELSRALGSSQKEIDDYLQPDVFVSASQRLYVLRVRGGDFSGAVTVFERLKASKTARRSKLYAEVVASLEPIYHEVMSVVAGPKVLRQKARIDEHDYWVHRMLRRSFAFGDVRGGKLDVVDVRCTRANRRLVSMPEDAVLKIPDTWGDCSVYIKGDEGTTFAFEEYPYGYANAIDPAQVAPTKE
jgi:TonB family protein